VVVGRRREKRAGKRQEWYYRQATGRRQAGDRQAAECRVLVKALWQGHGDGGPTGGVEPRIGLHVRVWQTQVSCGVVWFQGQQQRHMTWGRGRGERWKRDGGREMEGRETGERRGGQEHEQKTEEGSQKRARHGRHAAAPKQRRVVVMAGACSVEGWLGWLAVWRLVSGRGRGPGRPRRAGGEHTTRLAACVAESHSRLPTACLSAAVSWLSCWSRWSCWSCRVLSLGGSAVRVRQAIQAIRTMHALYPSARPSA
jgi:hypothetical protein